MRDIPVFTTENGVASLILSQIPYQKKAYIRIQSTLAPDEFIPECIGFCRAAGAEEIYATGFTFNSEPCFNVVRMQGSLCQIGDTEAAMMPLTVSTLEDWVSIYNKKVVSVPGGAYMTRMMASDMLKSGGGYWIHKDGNILGIGKISSGQIDWIASVSPGAGGDIVKALCHGIFTDTVTLEVCDANLKAVKLYESLGFMPVSLVDSWYRMIF